MRELHVNLSVSVFRRLVQRLAIVQCAVPAEDGPNRTRWVSNPFRVSVIMVGALGVRLGYAGTIWPWSRRWLDQLKHSRVARD
jgi:hypothetical protein